MSVMRVYTDIDVDSDLLEAAKKECDGLDLNTTRAWKVFPPGEKCFKIMESVNKQVCSQKGKSVEGRWI